MSVVSGCEFRYSRILVVRGGFGSRARALAAGVRFARYVRLMAVGCGFIFEWK